MEKNRFNALYHYEKQIENRLASIEEDTRIIPANKALIRKFHQHLLATNKREARQKFFLDRLAVLSRLIDKPWDKCNRADIEKLMKRLLDGNKVYSDHSRRAFVTTLKQFYRFFRKIEDKHVVPSEVAWLSVGTVRNKKETTVHDIFTKEEVEVLIAASTAVRDKALISTLYYTGVRVGELLSLSVQDVVFDDEDGYVTLHVDGKTGRRIIHVKEPFFLLKQYAELRHAKNDNEPFWIVTSRSIDRTDDPWSCVLGRRAVAKISKQLVKASGLTKRSNPHNYRHSRASYLAPRLSLHVFNKMFGWKGSAMYETYVHLSETVLKDATRQFYGDKRIHELPELIECKNCGLGNRSTLAMCERCGYPLTNDAIAKGIESRSGKRNMNLILNKLFETKEFKKAMARLLLDEGFLKYVERIAKHERALLDNEIA